MNEPGEIGVETITIVLADDHELVRNGIRLLLEEQPDMRVVAEAGDGDGAVRYALGHRPDVLVLDLSLSLDSESDPIPSVLEASPGTAIVVLTMQPDPAFAREALRSGAKAYVVKSSAASELVDAIRAVAAGETYVNPSLGARLATEPAASGPPDHLTPREIEILGLLALGYTNPEIAERLVLSVRTVETHRANIQNKTGTSTRAELIAYAVDNQLGEREA